MLLAKKSRHFVRHEFGLRPRRGKGVALPFISGDDTQDVRSILDAAIKADAAAYDVKTHDTVRITKLDVREQDDIAVFLVRRRDEEASTQVFEHGTTRALRTPDVDPKEAPAVSCHLFIRLTPIPGATPKHRAILEEVPGLGRTYINYILSSILTPKEYEYLDEKGKVRSTYTIPSLEGLPSETLGDALAGGSIKYVELLRPPLIEGLDMAGLTPHPQRMRLSVKADLNPLDVIGRIQQWAGQHDWSGIRVQVATSDDRTKVVEIAREAEAADILFVRSEIVITPSEIALCTDTINEELVKEAKAKLIADADW